MTAQLAVQIMVYVGLLCSITAVFCYAKGYRDALSDARKVAEVRTRRARRIASESE